jgi:hypothetical protein
VAQLTDGARFFKAAAELGLEGIVSKRPASRYRSGPSRSWLKTKNMVESEFILLGTERDSDGVPWALLASNRMASRVCRPGYIEPAAGAQSGLEGTDGSIGGRQAAGARVEAGLGSVASAWAAGPGQTSQGQGRAPTRDCQTVHQQLNTGADEGDSKIHMGATIWPTCRQLRCRIGSCLPQWRCRRSSPVGSGHDC